MIPCAFAAAFATSSEPCSPKSVAILPSRDLGPACTGTIGIAPSANLNPERRFPSLFEPVHGSAPDIAGKNVANPIGMIWSAALMLDFLGEHEAHEAIMAAIQSVLAGGPRTADLGGNASTQTAGAAIASRI